MLFFFADIIRDREITAVVTIKNEEHQEDVRIREKTKGCLTPGNVKNLIDDRLHENANHFVADRILENVNRLVDVRTHEVAGHLMDVHNLEVAGHLVDDRILGVAGCLVDVHILAKEITVDLTETIQGNYVFLLYKVFEKKRLKLWTKLNFALYFCFQIK